MGRQTASGELNDKIKGEGRGEAEWTRRTKSNKSLNPTALSLAFIKVVRCDVSYVAASGGGLSPALYAPESSNPKQGRKDFCSRSGRCREAV